MSTTAPTPDGSPSPTEPDVHLSVFLHRQRMGFVACLTAALIFVQEHQARHYVDAVTVDLDKREFPRLPNQILYLER